MFGSNSNKASAPSSVKKILLVLLVAGTFGYDFKTKKTGEERTGDTAYWNIFGFLEFTRRPDGTYSSELVLHDDNY